MKNFLFWQKNPKDGFYEVGALSGAALSKHVSVGAQLWQTTTIMATSMSHREPGGRPMLLRNDGGNKKNWITVRVKCHKVEPNGFGTNVEFKPGA